MMTYVFADATLLIRTATFAVLELMKTVQVLPAELSGYAYYLKAELQNACTKHQAENIFLIFVEFLPLITVELARLDPKNCKLFAMSFTNILTGTSLRVFRVFTRKLISVHQIGRYPLLKAFLHALFVVVNYQTEDYQIEILHILIAFLENANSNEIKKYSKQCSETILPICNRISLRAVSDLLHIALLELLELLLRRRLIHPSYAFEWADMLTKFLSSPLPMVRYWLSRLIQVLPERAAAQLTLLSVLGPPPVLRSLTPSPSTSSIGPIESQLKLIDLDHPPSARFRSRFVSSSRLSTRRIDHIFPTECYGDYIVIDSAGDAHYIALPSESTPNFQSGVIASIDQVITTGCGCTSGSTFALGFQSGLLRRYSTASVCALGEFTMPSSVTAIDYLDENSLLAGSDDGFVALFDFRADAAAGPRTMLSDPFSPIAGLTVWPNDNVVAGIGFADGIVTVFDLRMWLPFWCDTTCNMTRLLPVAVDTPGLSYLLMNREWVEVVVEPRVTPKERPRGTFLYSEAQRFRNAFPYRGGAVVVDDEGASFVHGNRGCPMLRLHDWATEFLVVEPDQGAWRIRRKPRDEERSVFYRSVHQHQGHITCGTIVGDVVVTCDDLGFVHQWRLAPEIRRVRLSSSQ
jgi:hypothetical protein